MTATANSIAGHYSVTAASAGSAPVGFSLTNQYGVAFSGLSDQSIVYGTASVTFAGKISDGSLAPAGEDVAVTLDGVTQEATIGSDGSFSTTFNDTAGLGVAGSPYTVSYSYAGDGTFPPASQTGKLTVTPATPTVSVHDAGGTYNGSPFVASAAVAGVSGQPGPSLEGVGLTLSYFTGSTATGTPLSGPPSAAGTDTVQASFAGSTDYVAATAQATFVIAQAAPTITWAKPGSIVYGTALGSAQLDATASVPGTFAYNPAAGAVLGAGVHTLSVTFTPTDTIDYATATAMTSITVSQATPAITWSTPAPITYGTPLGSGQLDASANVPGSFSYTPTAGTVLGAGTQTLSVIFTPSDTTDYTTATASIMISVNQVNPGITWSTPAAIVYGTALGSAQLDATANVPGSFAYNPAAGAVLGAGRDTLSVTFTPSDTTDYTTATATTTITVNQATPTITWSTPAPMTYGTALGSAQLDATASAPGTFAYTPAAGTVLGAGSQTLSVTFTPSDTADYTTATATTTITVNQAVPMITWAAPASIVYGTKLGPAQLDATAGVSGTFVYVPGTGAVPRAGMDTLSVTFTPTDSADYMQATATTSITVTQATPAITWNPPQPITYGTPLGSGQLDAAANVQGSFSYSPAAGTILGAGTQTLSVTFTPSDSTDYTSPTVQTSITVEPATPSVTWSSPAPIVYGTPLGGSQLDATANVPGSFLYSPAAGAVLGVGSDTLSVTFTPSDGTDFTPATATTSITVNQAIPAITWTSPISIVYGTSLGPGQLDASASVPGSFTYNPVAGTVLGAGTHQLSVTFSPTDSTDYTAATATTTLNVAQATPAIKWNSPASIVYGTRLGSGQLDASASVAGSFAYNPAGGAILARATRGSPSASRRPTPPITPRPRARRRSRSSVPSRRSASAAGAPSTIPPSPRRRW